MEKVEVSYSYLREVSESVTDFLRTEYWWDDDSNLKNSIETDPGITGDDAVELIEKFAEKYKINLDGFDFNKYFSPEGVSANPLLIPIIALALVLFLIKILIAGIIYLFDNEQSKRVFKFSVTKLFNDYFDKIWPNQHENLTVEDLITTVIKGKFTKRETVKFVMINKDIV